MLLLYFLIVLIGCAFFVHFYQNLQPVAQNFKVEHHPGGGHWFAAGLSPNVSFLTLTCTEMKFPSIKINKERRKESK